MIASSVGASGANATDVLTSLRAAAMCFAKCSATRGAAARAPPYRPPSMNDHCRLLAEDGRTVRAARDNPLDNGRWLLSPRETSAPDGTIRGVLPLPVLPVAPSRPPRARRRGIAGRTTRPAAPRERWRHPRGMYAARIRPDGPHGHARHRPLAHRSARSLSLPQDDEPRGLPPRETSRLRR